VSARFASHVVPVGLRLWGRPRIHRCRFQFPARV